MEYSTLNDGNLIPVLGFGTYKATHEEGLIAIKTALDLGYRLIDTAAKYGNEEQIGKALKQHPVKREEVLITTKFWREEMGYQEVKEAFNTSLKKLQTDYIDLYLIHWPANAKNYPDWKKANADTWRAMEELQAEGKIKSIGVSNFWSEHLDALLQTAKVVPAVNQIEFHPGYWQPEVVKYCKEQGINVQSWSPLARGKVFGNPLLEDIAGHHNKSVSQVCLRWVIQHGAIVIPKTVTALRMEENLAIFDFVLSAEEMLQIDQLPEMGFSGELPNLWPDRLLSK